MGTVNLPVFFHPSPRMLRQFAVGWLIFFLVLAAFRYRQEGWTPLTVAMAGAAGIGGIGGWVRPTLLRWVFIGMTLLAFPIGWVISQFALMAMFYGVITPVALVMKLRGRDRLARRKSPPDRLSYWLPVKPTTEIRQYFRQY